LIRSSVVYTLREEIFASGKIAKFLELTFVNDLFLNFSRE